MEQQEHDAAGLVSPLATQPRLVLQPGQLSKPEKVWSSSSTLIIGFYQAAPYSETFKIFYKKSGAVFGTQVTLTPASILGPELAVRPPVAGEAQYFEYEIKKLKPSTQYVIKIKTSDDASEVRSDKMGTVSAEEERSRDNDMRNFVGALVKLGEYDGLVLSYAAQSGVFTLRILQMDDVAACLQLARLTSDYTDNGVPVQAYTLSEIRFGRWGGAITGSKVVNEGELKWLVARAVQMGDKSDAAAAFEARQRLLQAQVEKVTLGLEAEWATRFRNLRLRAAAYLLLLALVAVAAGGGCWTLLSRSGRRQRDLEAQLGAAGARLAETEAELQLLHLYRVSLELDMRQRAAAAPELRLRSDGAAAAEGGGGNTTTSSGGGDSAGAGNSGDGGGGGGRIAGGNDSSSSSSRLRSLLRRQSPSRSGGTAARPVRRRAGQQAEQAERLEGRRRQAAGGIKPRAARLAGDAAVRRVARDADGSGGAGGGKGGDGGRPHGPRAAGGAAATASGGAGLALGATQLWGLPHAALRRAMARGRFGRAAAAGTADDDWASYVASRSASRKEGSEEDEEPQPDAWAFIHYVSHVYAMHLQEWMKMQLQKTVRREVNEMLVPAGEEGGGEGTGASSGGGGGDEGSGRRRRRAAAGAASRGDSDLREHGHGCSAEGGGAERGQCQKQGDDEGYDGYDGGDYGDYYGMDDEYDY